MQLWEINFVTTQIHLFNTYFMGPKYEVQRKRHVVLKV